MSDARDEHPTAHPADPPIEFDADPAIVAWKTVPAVRRVPLGNSQVTVLPVAQLASLTGVYGVTALVVGE